MPKVDYTRQDEWKKKNIEVVTIRLYKGRRADLKKYADEHGMAFNRLVINALEAYTGIPVGTRKEKAMAEDVADEK